MAERIINKRNLFSRVVSWKKVVFYFRICIDKKKGTNIYSTISYLFYGQEFDYIFHSRISEN